MFHKCMPEYGQSTIFANVSLIYRKYQKGSVFMMTKIEF